MKGRKPGGLYLARRYRNWVANDCAIIASSGFSILHSIFPLLSFFLLCCLSKLLFFLPVLFYCVRSVVSLSSVIPVPNFGFPFCSSSVLESSDSLLFLLLYSPLFLLSLTLLRPKFIISLSPSPYFIVISLSSPHHLLIPFSPFSTPSLTIASSSSLPPFLTFRSHFPIQRFMA